MKGVTYILIFCLLAVCSCNRNNGIPNTTVMPEELRFVLLEKDGKPFIDSPQVSIRMFFIQDGREVNLGDECKQPNCSIIRSFGELGPYPYYYQSLSAPLMSGDSNLKTYYLQVGSNDVDTVFLDVVSTGSTDPKIGAYTYRQVAFNGKKVEINRTTMPWVYVFQK